MAGGNWRRFAIWLFASGAGGIVALFLLLAAFDPWGALPLRAPLPRAAADRSQRWAYPELARDRRFNAAIFGNSTARLIVPDILNAALDARFVNLAMVHAEAFEQARLLDVFTRAHAHPGAVIVGIDRVWCERGPKIALYGYDPIPDWLYDGDTLAAYANLLNLHAIDTASRAIAESLGLSRPRYGRDGYMLLAFDTRAYEAASAHAEQAREEAVPWPDPPGPDPSAWNYPALDWLAQRLKALPADTRKLLVFVPLHHLYPPPDGPGPAMMAECKRRVAAMAARWPNTTVIDFAIPSAITENDDNWWDAMHDRVPVAAQVTRDIAAIAQGHDVPDANVMAGKPAVQTSAAQ